MSLREVHSTFPLRDVMKVKLQEVGYVLVGMDLVDLRNCMILHPKKVWKLNPSDRTIALTKLVIKHANLHTKETEIGA